MANKKDKWEGSTRLRTDGRWETSICIDGNRKSFYGKNEAESKKKMREYRNKIAAGYINPKRILFSEYCYDWLLQTKYNRVRDSTFDRYESTYLYHIKDTIGKKHLGSISSNDIQTLLNNKAYPTNNNTPLSSSSVKKIYEIINPCLQYAYIHKHIGTNPCVDVVLPLESKYIKQTKETVILNDEEIRLLKEQCLMKDIYGSYKYKNGLYFLLILNTGLRCGELLGLEWSNIDINNQWIYVENSLQSNVKVRDSKSKNKRTSKISQPKTKRGIRYIPLNEQAIFVLQQIKLYNEEHHIKTKYVASTSTGSRVTARNLQRTLDILIQNANLKHFSLHDLRRTFGSTLLRNKVDISVVSELMGHSSVRITYDAYIKILQEQKVSAVKLINVS